MGALRFIIPVMSEKSLPPFGPLGRTGPFGWPRYPLSAIGRTLKQKLGRVFKSRGAHHAAFEVKGAELRPTAAAELDSFVRANPALFERAERLRERAERTGSDGTPSESASLRAARARGEALAALAGTRAAFVAGHGEGAAEAFDLEFEARYPVVPAGPRQDDVIEP